jgi:hypothetical protein
VIGSVAKHSSRSEPSVDRFGPVHPFTFAEVEKATDPPLAGKQRRRLRQVGSSVTPQGARVAAWSFCSSTSRRSCAKPRQPRGTAAYFHHSEVPKVRARVNTVHLGELGQPPDAPRSLERSDPALTSVTRRCSGRSLGGPLRV